MTKADSIFIGFILCLLITVAHYNIIAGSIYAVILTLINLLDTKKPVGRD